MSSPVSAQSSPRLFPLADMIEGQMQRDSADYVDEHKVNVDDFQGVEAIRADIEPVIHTLYESTTGRYQYLVADPVSKDAVIIDPVLDLNPYSPGIATTAADQILYLVRLHRYRVVRILETHSVQEHPTSAWYLRTQLRDCNGQMPRICTGKAIAGMQRMFARQYQVQDAGWSSRFDFFRDGQIFVVGEMKVQCMHLLSQPDWFGFIIGHNLFLGKEVPKEMTESHAVRPTQQIPMRKLARFADGYAFHPQTQKNDEHSRPSSAQTEVSQWMYDAVRPRNETMAAHEQATARREPDSPRSPRGSSGMARMRRIMGRQHSREDWSSVSSRDSSRQSNRRISHLIELA